MWRSWASWFNKFVFVLSSSSDWGRIQQWNRGGDLWLREWRRPITLTLRPRWLHLHLLTSVPSIGEEASHGLHGGADQQHGEGLQEERLPGNTRQGRALQEAQSVWQTGIHPQSVIIMRQLSSPLSSCPLDWLPEYISIRLLLRQ